MEDDVTLYQLIRDCRPGTPVGLALDRTTSRRINNLRGQMTLDVFHQGKVIIAVTCLVMLLALWLVPNRPGGQALAAGPGGGEVHGTIYASLRGVQAQDPYLFLPDITVFLKNVKTSAVTKDITTDLDGAFTIPEQPQAEYQLCWKAQGYLAGCGAPFLLRGPNVSLKPQTISPNLDLGTVYGRVALKDGNACRFSAPFIGANVFTTVTAKVGSATRTVRANNSGGYLVAGLPSFGSAKIIAACEGAQASTTNTLAAGSPRLSNLTLPNARPRTLGYAAQGGKTVGAVAPGTTVQATVQAKDGGGYPLHYKWYLSPPVSSFTSIDSPTISWKIPAHGLATAYVWSGDGNGGNALTRIALSTTPDQIPFSGHVLGNDAPVLAGARVTINGVSAQTNARGDFSLTLPKEDPRYVITITKPGYQMLSKIQYNPVTGAVFKLYRARDTVVDPTKPIAVRVVSGREGSVGIEIQIPANSIAAGVDGKGPLATTPLHLRALPYDLNDPENQVPGDFGGTDGSNKAYRLATFGAANVDLQDDANQAFNLVPGKTATISVLIDPSQQAVAPSTIPVWHYDTARGLWLRDGKATRVGNFYKTNVKHFSAVNMDLSTANDGACTRVVVDPGIMDLPFKIRMYPLTGGLTVRPDHQDQIISASLNVVVREPPGIQVKFVMVDSNGNDIAASAQIVNVGAASPSGSMWNPPPSAPYLDCTSEVDYNVDTVKALWPVPPQGFLSYKTPPDYLDPTKAPALTSAYYNLIDPGGTKTKANDTNDFANWKNVNGFNRTGEVITVYQNQYDLGFGREMHMQTGGQTGSCLNCVAYYVTNYENVGNAVLGTNPKQTVAMEFSPQNGVTGTPYTKFYVYNADGTISLSADLDGNGQKYVPALCVVCHNGNIASMDPVTGNLNTARFIGFDVESFGFAPSKPRPSQEPAFKQMNQGIVNQTNVSGPLKSQIFNWYGTETDPSMPSSTFLPNVPSKWLNPVDESNLYNAVVKKSCRSCHTTRDPNDTGVDISWATYDSVNTDPLVRAFACTPGVHIMPQAKVTFARFWLSTDPNGPNTFASSDLTDFKSPNNSCN
jgi:hypothetical protein